jgi:hypothetical protein
MPARHARSPLAVATSALAVAALAAAALAACADPATAPDARRAADAVDAAPAATALLDFTAATSTYWSGFNFLFDASGQPLGGAWPDHPPTPWRPTDFDVAKHSRDAWTWFEPQPFRGMHGTMCQPYQNAEPGNEVRADNAGSHAIATWSDANYRCRNHMMTSLKSAGYAVIYVTPNAMIDFSSGEATIRFALSTTRMSATDWVDIWVTPWEYNLALPLDAGLGAVDLQGPPRYGIHVRMVPGDRARSAFEAYAIMNHRETRLPSDPRGYESFLTPTSTFRDTFELRVSRSRVKFGITARTAGAQTHPAFTWVDASYNMPGWVTGGVVQFGHHSMNQSLGDNAGVGGTWHWDDYRFSPGLPFTIVRPVVGAGGERVRSVDPRNMATPVQFERAAPPGSFLRFSAIGVGLQVSFDGGDSWRDAQVQDAADDRIDRFRSYWTPVPRNASAVLFRSVLRGNDERPALGPFLAQDFSIWSRSP